MTLIQEMFSKTVNHMRQQGNPWGYWADRGWTFVNPKNPCQRCAQGIHMDVKLVNGTYRIDPYRYYDIICGDTAIHYMMIKLQGIFERSPIEKWEIHFRKIATENNLTLPDVPMKQTDIPLIKETV